MVGKESKLGFVVAGLLLAILMAAMDNTIVATSMGTIVADLGGFDKFVWVTSAYLVTVMAGTPIFGKLSDMYGRKRFFIFGLTVFLFGSILCGTAGSMTQLSIYRAIQGVGGGALMPIAFTIIFDIFPPEKRGKMTGLFGAVFGLSSLFGPLLGAYISDNIGWHWIFFINIPLGILSFVFVFFYYKESLEHKEQRIDWLGAFTLVGAVVCLMFALELGGNQYDWASSVIISLFTGFAVFFILFLYVETKVAEPIISFKMFKKRLFATSNAIAFFYGTTFIIATIYIPIFVQGVFGGTATNSGLILTPMMLGSVFGSQLGGLLTTKTSYRNIMLCSGAFFITGVFLLSTLSPETARSVVTLFMIITGFGVGFSFSTLSMSAIHNFDMRQRGAATSSVTFFRSLGMTLGITIFGIIQRNLFQNKLADEFAGMGNGGSFGDSRALLSPETREKIPAPILEKITDSLSSSIAQTFMWALVPAVLAFIFIFLMSKERIEMPAKKTKMVKA
ncbi:MDR family MFS transporter [Lederbergia citrea]|uniref:MFS transporter n=1 Tax=Lederbergia citrea TaxID=2833581 RepID=A0A942Z405_9BACI|nr:MDR family MFS transporter [Lederbergia citrea]MBS4204164.1 MFS transporter [Lederbergia citrea]MBS4221251.1 MFS transporter [Lederbergia citrea]